MYSSAMEVLFGLAKFLRAGHSLGSLSDSWREARGQEWIERIHG